MRKIKIYRCYCQIPAKKLRELSRLRYARGIPTERLMKRMKTRREKEYLAAVALLDVKRKDLPPRLLCRRCL
jgi:hypothetical protein